jgi:hypothetical protein
MLMLNYSSNSLEISYIIYNNTVNACKRSIEIDTYQGIKDKYLS